MPSRVKQVRLQRNAGANLPRGDLVHLALWGPTFGDEAPVSAALWENVRADAWVAWRAARAAGRRGAYPPDGAQRHDGLQGRSVTVYLSDKAADLAFAAAQVPQDLAALAAFRRSHPAAAAALRSHLQRYAAALRRRLARHDEVWVAKRRAVGGVP